MPHPRSARRRGADVHKRRLNGVWLIELDQIEPDPDQPRKRVDPTHLEAQTGLDFFTIIPVEFQEQFEAVVATDLWALEAVFFAPAPALIEEAPLVVPPREPRRAVVGRPSPRRLVPAVPKTNVGGYVNTGWDLVSNLAGAVIASGLLWGTRRCSGCRSKPESGLSPSL